MRRLLAALAAVAALGVALVPVPAGAEGPARQAEPEAGGAAMDPFDRFAGCIGAGGRLLVVLLVDESGSLNTTDPDDQRVAAAQAALASLDRLRATETGGVAPTIDVLVSVFSYDFQPVGPWTTLGPAPAATPAVERRVAGLARRSSGMDTDFHNALDGARLALADRATSLTALGGGEVCKAVLLFTDGNFALGARTTPEQRERFGTTKAYAPGIVLDSEEAAREATGLGVDALCAPGGVADDIRSDRITLLTVPLNVDLAEPGEDPRPSLGEGARRLLEALTVGRAEERTCGDPDTAVPGVYLEASDTVELLRTFDLIGSRIAGGSPVDEPARVPTCPDEPCADGTVPFAVDRSLRRVHLFVAVPGEGARVVLVPPEGDDLEVEPGEDAAEEVGGLDATVTWLSDRAATVDLEVPPDGTGSGRWAVAVVGSEGEGVVQVVTFSDVIAALVDTSWLQYGDAATIHAEIMSRSGEGEVPELEAATVTATVTDPITGRSVVTDDASGEATSLALERDGERFTASLTVPTSVTAVAVRVGLRLQGTTAEGAVITSVAPDVDLAVRRPDGYPQVAPARLDLSSIDGDGAAQGELVLVAPDESGCAWFEGLEVASAPDEAGALAAEVEGLGRGEGSCTELSGPLTVPVRITAADRASGTVNGHVRLYLARDGGEEPLATDIPVSFEMARGIDEAKRLLLAVVLLVGGLLAPLVLLVAINVVTTRFQRLSAVRATRIPVAVTGRHQIVRTDGDRRSLRLLGTDFHPLEGEGRRRFRWGGLVFRARTSMNPFGEPYATVAPEGGTADVARSARRTDLALGLTGSWLFLLDQDATNAATERWVARHGGERPSDPPEIHGHVVAFVAEGPVAAQASRLVGDMDERLPATARALARIAGLGG